MSFVFFNLLWCLSVKLTHSTITEQLITPAQFAEILCDDLDLNPLAFVPAIEASIKQQLEACPSTEPDPNAADQRVIIKVWGISFWMQSTYFCTSV